MELEKSSIKVPNVSSLPVSVDGLNNLVQGASIQIMSQAEAEVSRLPQYRTLEVRPISSIVRTSHIQPSQDRPEVGTQKKIGDRRLLHMPSDE